MKNALIILLALMVTLTAFGAALAEDAENAAILCDIVDGSYTILIPVEENDAGTWLLDGEVNDGGVVKIVKALYTDNGFEAQIDPVGDGEAVVTALHEYHMGVYDAVHTWTLRVQDGAVAECTGGSYTAMLAEQDLDDYFRGEWLEKDTQFTRLSAAKNPELGWDIEIVSPLTHGAYLFRATVYYDCLEEGFLYRDGLLYDLPTDDSGLGDPVRAGLTGSLKYEADEGGEISLRWTDSDSPDQSIVFVRTEAEESGVTAHDFLGEWVDLDGICNIDITEHKDEDTVDGYVVNVQMNDAEARSYTVWAYGCVYDEEACTLNSISRFTGVGDYEPGSEETITETNLEYTDAQFYFDEEGKLIWLDANENACIGMKFEHTLGWTDPDYIGPGHHFVGEWNEERVSVKIEEDPENYYVVVSGSNGAYSSTVWSYTCVYDEATDSLICDGKDESASKFNVTVDDEGEEDVEVEYEDGAATFSINADGFLIWNDQKENCGEGRLFEKADME